MATYLQECSNVLTSELLEVASMQDFMVGVAEPDKLYVYVFSNRIERTIRNRVSQYLSTISLQGKRIFIEVKRSGRPKPAI